MNVGGPATLISELINGFSEQDIEHILVTGKCAENEVDFLDSHKLKSQIVRIDSIGRSVSLIRDCQAFFRLIRLLRNLNPNVVHTHTSKAGFIGRLAAFISIPKAKIVHTYHGHLLYGYFSPWKLRIFLNLERVVASMSDVLVGVTNQVVSELQEVGIGKRIKWLTVYPGIKSLSVNNLPTGRNKTQKYKVSWIGRFTSIKNPQLAIRIVEGLNRDHPGEYDFTFVGGGELLQDIQKIVNEKKLPVTFTGWINDVSEVLRNSDLLLMTSHNEGMPVTILEAASLKLPTFSTNIGGVSEFIEDGISGFLFKEDSLINEVVMKVHDALADTDGFEKIREQVLEKYLRHFTLDQAISSQVKIYCELANE